MADLDQSFWKNNWIIQHRYTKGHCPSLPKGYSRTHTPGGKLLLKAPTKEPFNIGLGPVILRSGENAGLEQNFQERLKLILFWESNMLSSYLTSYILLCTCQLKKQRQKHENQNNMTKHIDQKGNKQMTQRQNISLVSSQIQRNMVNSVFNSPKCL